MRALFSFEAFAVYLLLSFTLLPAYGLWRWRATGGRSLPGAIALAVPLLTVLLHAAFVGLAFVMPRLAERPGAVFVIGGVYGAALGWYCYQTKQLHARHLGLVLLGLPLFMAINFMASLLIGCAMGNCL